MNGLLCVNKAPGMTSRDVVNIVQRKLRPVKVGHAGTLDPLASGVLVLTVGKATRLTEYVQQMKKSYIGGFRFGFSSDTEDIEGEVRELPSCRPPTSSQVVEVLRTFVGEIQQMPPAFSALKVKGKRAYELARRGESVELKARPVHIYSLALAGYDYPDFTLQIDCGSGTYVRSLGRDIARELGTEAIMTSLERTAIGNYTLANAVPANQLREVELDTHILPMSSAVSELPQVDVSSEDVNRIKNGLSIDLDIDVAEEHRPSELAAIGPAGDLVAIIVARNDKFGPRKSFISG